MLQMQKLTSREGKSLAHDYLRVKLLLQESNNIGLSVCEHIGAWNCFWAFYSIALVYLSILLPELHLVTYCCSVISFSIQWSKSVIGPLHFHINLRIRLSVPSFHKVNKQKLPWFSLRLHGICRLVWGELLPLQYWIFKTMNMVCLSILYVL